jgi:oligosaccharide repeat unit polymerase
MKIRKKKLSTNNLFNPYIHILFFISIALLANIPNGLNWNHGKELYVPETLYLHFLYVVFFLLGYVFFQKKKIAIDRSIQHDKSKVHVRYIVVYTFCLILFLFKFFKTGDMPIVSDDSFLRQRANALGGYVDYPTKLLNFLAIYGFYLYKKTKIKKYLLFVVIGITINILFANRGFTVLILIGIFMVYFHKRKNTFATVLYTSIVVVFIFLTIALVQIARHGIENIYSGSFLNPVQIALWIVHGDLVGPTQRGAYLIQNYIHAGDLNGNYTLGSFLSIVIPNYTSHGAVMINEQFIGAKSAQSIAIPYSLFVDFGWMYLVIATLTGAVSSVIYKFSLQDNSSFFLILYIALYYNLLWSIRSGILVIDPILIYCGCGLLFVIGYRSKHRLVKYFVDILRILYVFSMAISIVALIIRF